MMGNPAAKRIDYVWHKLSIVTRWWPTGRNIVLSFNTPPALRMRFPAPLLDDLNFESTHDPFWIHILLLEELVVLHDASIWSIRDVVRLTELVRPISLSQAPFRRQC